MGRTMTRPDRRPQANPVPWAAPQEAWERFRDPVGRSWGLLRRPGALNPATGAETQSGTEPGSSGPVEEYGGPMGGSGSEGGMGHGS